jgi:hypothetical protein
MASDYCQRRSWIAVFRLWVFGLVLRFQGVSSGSVIRILGCSVPSAIKRRNEHCAWSCCGPKAPTEPMTDAASPPCDHLKPLDASQANCPEQQSHHDRKREQAESGIAVRSPFRALQLSVLHMQSLLFDKRVVSDGRYTCCWSLVIGGRSLAQPPGRRESGVPNGLRVLRRKSPVTKH